MRSAVRKAGVFMAGFARKVLSVLVALSVFLIILTAAALPIAAYFLLERLLFFILVGVYFLLSFRVTWNLCDDKTWSIRFCIIKAMIILFCILSLWGHLAHPEAFRCGMPQQTEADLELVILAIFYIEAVVTIWGLLKKRVLEPLTEKFNLDFYF